MMGKTHVAVGILTSLLVFQPTTITACAATIAGGALGGSAADIDAIKTDHNQDALLGQLIPVGITGAMLLVEHFFRGSITSSLQDPNRAAMVAGAAFYFLLLAKGYASGHRTFTHSILTAVLFTVAIYLVWPMAAPGYFAGYLSHLLLDSLNRKDIRLFYPLKKGISLKLCYADGKANSVLCWVGTTGSVVMTALLMLRVFG